jgi:hypothetical protein
MRGCASTSINIPDGAAEALRPYVESGMKFFVARVDVDRVRFESGRAVLSPLRVHYDTSSSPCPCAWVSSARRARRISSCRSSRANQRYEVANYPNVFIPTNLDVSDDVRERFGDFYGALFDRTIERNPGAVVTEYAWQATTCDPCPGPTLTPADMMTLGADVTPTQEAWGFTLTRLNNFQGRYAMLHPWVGPVACESPQRGAWGGPPDRDDWFAMPPPRGAGSTFARTADATPPPALAAAVEGALAWSPVPTELRGGAAASALVASQDLGATPTPPTTPTPAPTTAPTPTAPIRTNEAAPPAAAATSGCGCHAQRARGGLEVLGLALALATLARRRRIS